MTEKEVLEIIERAAREGSTVLDLSGEDLKWLPGKIGELTNLKELKLFYNQLTSVPRELGQLENLNGLDLDNNKLTSVPAELGQLKNLITLELQNNQLTSVPGELGQLENLTELWLYNNQLRSVPAELGQLENLTSLHLGGNQLRSVPAELGQLTKLEELQLYGNPLESPPPEVVEQGTEAVLAYLRGQLKEKKAQWVSKLLVVGEGGVGKTSLLRSLRGEGFVEGLETTHGIGVEKLPLAHPSEAGVTMELNTWDFGGQQIYHATHQFFLTNRSLFVLVWDARHGWEAGKLYQWLDRIQTRAPESPVMLVGAHIDERDADLPLDDLRKKYPQIEGHYKVSNKTGAGIEQLRERLGHVAAELPLMGEEWPGAWLDAANEIRAITEHHISPKRLFEVMGRHDVKGKGADVLAQWLHELGDILYFREDDELNDTVILDPVWVTEAISDVLESEEVIGKEGILTRVHRDELWRENDEHIREHFLRLMERFDLSYRTLENREISLVVERLPLGPPDYGRTWDEIRARQGSKEISMKFSLSSVPAGIPTWFIARSHRFTTHTHWRMGALFADSKDKQHLGLIEAYPHDRYLRLTVHGPAPHNFFALLRDGLELTLARFPGLKIKRTVPCPGHDDDKCAHEFDLAQLEKAVTRGKPAMDIQCPEAFEDVSIPGLLFGLHWSTEGQLMDRVEELEAKVLAGQEDIRSQLSELTKLSQRYFLKIFNAQQRLEQSHCPNVFAVAPKEGNRWLENIVGQKMVLQLYCQAPGAWHPTVEGGEYEIRKPAEWLSTVGPYIVKLAKVIKYAAPVAGAAAELYVKGIGEVLGTDLAEKLGKQVKLMEELAKKIKTDDKGFAAMEARAGIGGREGPERIEGAALRALRKLLDEVDPAHHWGGLKKILTPEGHYLWLCEYHAEEYAN